MKPGMFPVREASKQEAQKGINTLKNQNEEKAVNKTSYPNHKKTSKKIHSVRHKVRGRPEKRKMGPGAKLSMELTLSTPCVNSHGCSCAADSDKAKRGKGEGSRKPKDCSVLRRDRCDPTPFLGSHRCGYQVSQSRSMSCLREIVLKDFHTAGAKMYFREKGTNSYSSIMSLVYSLTPTRFRISRR